MERKTQLQSSKGNWEYNLKEKKNALLLRKNNRLIGLLFQKKTKLAQRSFNALHCSMCAYPTLSSLR